jgi:hypothetical protein
MQSAANGLASPFCYRAVAFDCGDGVTIRLCPELVQTRTYPEYWFIRRDLHSWDDVELWRSGFKTLYWSEVGWQHHTPKQFTTAQKAMDYHRATLSDNDQTLPTEGAAKKP